MKDCLSPKKLFSIVDFTGFCGPCFTCSIALKRKESSRSGGQRAEVHLLCHRHDVSGRAVKVDRERSTLLGRI